jgi:hypothetical protein
MRSQAAGLARLYASERARDGDPEGAAAMQDLAKAILRIPLNDPR